MFKLNIWTYINIRYFKMKYTRTLVYFTMGLNALKLNEVKVFYKDWIFENFYEIFFKYFILVIVIFLFI